MFDMLKRKRQLRDKRNYMFFFSQRTSYPVFPGFLRMLGKLASQQLVRSLTKIKVVFFQFLKMSALARFNK